MGLHYGEPKVRGQDYWGEDVHFAARVCSAAHGGQVDHERRHAGDRRRRPGRVSLGHHGLKDFPTPRELFQLVARRRAAGAVPGAAHPVDLPLQPALDQHAG